MNNMLQKTTYINFTIRIKEEELKKLKKEAEKKDMSPNKLAAKILEAEIAKNAPKPFGSFKGLEEIQEYNKVNNVFSDIMPIEEMERLSYE